MRSPIDPYLGPRPQFSTNDFHHSASEGSRVEAVQWTIALLLGAPSALLIALNWLSFIAYVIAVRRGHKGSHSFAPPFVCGIAGAVACLVCPWPDVWRWAWVPPLLDPSTLLLLVALMLHVVARLTGLRSPFDSQPPQTPEGSRPL